MKFIKFVSILIVLSLFSTLALAENNISGGGHVGNGGDELRNLFREIRAVQSRRIENFSPCSFYGIATGKTVEWLLDNKNHLAEDILETEHRWTKEPTPTCANTLLELHSPIELSFPTCGQMHSTYDPIAKLLVHESVHHLGVEEEDFADEIALLALKARSVPNCTGSENRTIIKTGFAQSCTLSSGVLTCESSHIGHGHGPLVVDFGSQLPVTDFAVGDMFRCGIVEGAVKSTSWNSGNWIANNIPSIHQAFSIKSDSHTICVVDQFGLVCWGKINKRFPVQDISDFAVASEAISIISQGRVYYTESDLNPLAELKGILNARAVTAHGSFRTCAIDDLGVACWSRFPERGLDRVAGLLAPEKIEVSDKWACVLDGTAVKCWRHNNLDKVKTIIPMVQAHLASALYRDTYCIENPSGGSPICIDLE